MKGKSYRDAAEEVEQSKGKTESDEEETAPKAAPKPKKMSSSKEPYASLSKNISPRTGLKVEVVIPALPKRRTSPASSVATAPPTSEAEREEDSDAPRARRAVKRKAIVISDDDESEPEAPKKNGKGKGKVAAKKRPAKRSKASDDSDYGGSDFEASEDEDEELDAETFDESDDDEKPKKGKAKPKPKAPTKKRAPAKKAKSAPTTSESEDAMDVDVEGDEESKPAGKGKKLPAKKPKTEAKPPKEKKRREDSDPWKLKSAAVRRDWTQMQAPPLEMFHFARKIVDEYTYLDGKVLSMVTSLKAERHWVLSGTPPIHDFGALKTISAFLNIHLGIDDDNEGQSLQVKKRKREQTGKFTPW